MSDEIKFVRESGDVYWLMIRRASDMKVWCETDETWETYGETNHDITDYALITTDQSGGLYSADLPLSTIINELANDIYYIFIYLQDDTIPNIDDAFNGGFEFAWTKDGEATLLTITNIQESDWVINTANSLQWVLELKLRGTSTVLLTKNLKDIAGDPLISVAYVIGSQVEV